MELTHSTTHPQVFKEDFNTQKTSSRYGHRLPNLNSLPCGPHLTSEKISKGDTCPKSWAVLVNQRVPDLEQV